ncbi:hypothetical protein HWV62_27777 [Athelia sp. TMB]|nr:hypothetical protein HWV62_27777 [Athelia sp. TMB]
MCAWNSRTIQPIAFYRDLFAWIIYDTPDNDQAAMFVEIFNWRLSSTNMQHKALIRIPLVTSARSRYKFMSILPNHKILLVTDEDIWLYKIPEIQPCASTPSMRPIRTGIQIPPVSLGSMLWQPGSVREISQPFVGRSSSLLTFARGANVHGLSIPHDDVSPNSVTTLASFGSERAPFVIVPGLRRSFVRLVSSGLALSGALMLSHPPPGMEGDSTGGQITGYIVAEAIPPVVDHPMFQKMLMDEGTGRVVHVCGSDPRVLVMDLSHHPPGQDDLHS